MASVAAINMGSYVRYSVCEPFKARYVSLISAMNPCVHAAKIGNFIVFLPECYTLLPYYLLLFLRYGSILNKYRICFIKK